MPALRPALIRRNQRFRIRRIGRLLTVAVVVLPIAAAANYDTVTAASNTPGLVAAYSFDEGSGSTVNDLSGNGNNGTISGASWTSAGKYGAALAFNGSSSWVTVPDSSSLDLTSGLTLEAWVKPASLNGWQAVLLKEQTNDLVYALYGNSDTGQPAEFVYSDGAEHYTRGGAQLPLNTWTHVAATYDGTTLRLYVNGTQISSAANSGPLTTSSGALRIGGDSIWGEYFNGLIDEVRIYNYPLTASQIQTDMSTRLGSASGVDTTPPSAPSNLTVAGAAATSISLGWGPSSDNVGVTGYDLYLNGTKIAATASTSYTFVGLSCATAYTLSVDAYDAAGNRSAQTSIQANTTACGDTVPPTAPTNLTQTGATQTAIPVSWASSTDNVGVAGYGLYVNGTSVGSTTATSYTFSGLSCGASYTLAVDAYDAAGNRSAKTSITASTAACTDTTPPSAPSGFVSTGSTQASISTSWTASSDNVGVVGYDLYLNGASVGTTGGTSYTFSGLSCGTSYALSVDAYDAAGNHSQQTSLTAATAACSASGANWFLSPTGSDSNPCTQAQPCASLQRAYNLASPGQVVELAGGSYPSQSVSGSRSSGPAVIFRPASGASVTIASIDMYADWIEIRDLTVNGLATWGTSNHATFRNVTDHSRIYIAGSSNLTIIGGSVGPYVDAESWITHDNGVIPTNVLIQGVHFHDFTVSNSTIHTECMLVIAGNGLTFDGDTWTNCAIFDLSFGYCCSSPAQPTNVTIENNFFGGSIQDQAGTTLQFNTNLNPVNYTIRYNSSGGGGFVLDQGQTTFQNVVAIGNAEPGPWSCGRVQWSYNIFTGSSCPGYGDKLVPNLDFVNPGAGDFHLTAGAPEINAGDPNNYPATDWDGQSRPMGGAPDAGADEAG